jgi:hypothetical protein
LKFQSTATCTFRKSKKQQALFDAGALPTFPAETKKSES